MGTVWLWQVAYRCVRRWISAAGEPLPAWAAKQVSVGELGDGRWYVDLVEQVTRPAHTYPTEAEAQAAADRIMHHYGGEWQPVH